MAFADIYSNGFRSDLKKPSESKKVEEEKWVEGVRYPTYSFVSSANYIEWLINLLPISGKNKIMLLVWLSRCCVRNTKY